MTLFAACGFWGTILPDKPQAADIWRDYVLKGVYEHEFT